MKKNFLLMCGLLLGVCGFVACSDDETTPAPEPTFPELVTKTASAGDVVELSFKANYEWTATISEDTYTYFQLLSGETTVNTVSGTIGNHTIKVAVADDVIFENAPVAEVTLTMNGISQVIAQITYPTTVRTATVYAPEVNSWGGFKSAGTGSELLYSYNATAMTADDAVAMAWGAERKNNDDAYTFYAPVLVDANFDYTLAGPEWMVAAEAGVAGQTEYIIKADATKIPAESETATIEVLNGEESISSFKVSITGVNDFVPQLALMAEAEYDYDGTDIDEVSGTLTAGNFVKVVCDVTGAAAEWLTVTETAVEEGDAAIKTYEVSATAAANEGAVRTAYIFYFAQNDAPAADAVLFDEEGNVKEEYSANLAVTVTQYSEPATIEGTVDDTCATFAEVDDTFESTWFFEELNVHIGSKYTLNYWGASAIYAHENTYFTASSPIESITCYAYNAGGSLVEVDNDWVRATTFGTEEEKVKFRVYCDDLSLIPEAAKNWQNGEGEATILIKHTDGSYSAIYFHIGAGAAEGDGGVAFANADSVGAGVATIEKITSGDLYDTYFYNYSSESMPADVYHLTYKMDMSSMLSVVSLTGIDASWTTQVADPTSTDIAWLSWDTGKTAASMAVEGNGKTAAIIFKDENTIAKLIIICTLDIEE